MKTVHFVHCSDRLGVCVNTINTLDNSWVGVDWSKSAAAMRGFWREKCGGWGIHVTGNGLEDSVSDQWEKGRGEDSQ